MLPSTEIIAAGMVVPVGLTVNAAAAAIRARISRVRETHLRDSQFAPVVAGLLEDRYLPSLAKELTGAMKGMSARHQRMVRLGARALQEVAAGNDTPLPPGVGLAGAVPLG